MVLPLPEASQTLSEQAGGGWVLVAPSSFFSSSSHWRRSFYRWWFALLPAALHAVHCILLPNFMAGFAALADYKAGVCPVRLNYGIAWHSRSPSIGGSLSATSCGIMITQFLSYLRSSPFWQPPLGSHPADVQTIVDVLMFPTFTSLGEHMLAPTIIWIIFSAVVASSRTEVWPFYIVGSLNIVALREQITESIREGISFFSVPRAIDLPNKDICCRPSEFWISNSVRCCKLWRIILE